MQKRPQINNIEKVESLLVGVVSFFEEGVL